MIRRMQDDIDFAFLSGMPAKDDLAEQLGEDAMLEATTGEAASEVFDQLVPEEDGGPFVITTGAVEFGLKPDASNPEDSTREPFPTV